MLATTTSFCRSLLKGDSKRALADKTPRRVRDNAPYLSLRGLLFLLALLSQLFALNFTARATELTDLGEGLAYLRVHAIDVSAPSLTSAIREREFLIVDLRHAAGSATSSELLRTALAARTPKLPVFILVGPATPTAIVDSFTPPSGKCLTLGVKEAFPLPQVVIDQPADTDRLAYDALESGQPLAKLITGKVTKERYDEEVLMKEFVSGNIDAAPPPAPDPTRKPADAAKPAPSTVNTGETPDQKSTAVPVVSGLEPPVVSKVEPPGVSKVEPPGVSKVEPLIDRVLQRAVHLHRALAAIKQR